MFMVFSSKSYFVLNVRLNERKITDTHTSKKINAHKDCEHVIFFLKVGIFFLLLLSQQSIAVQLQLNARSAHASCVSTV